MARFLETYAKKIRTHIAELQVLFKFLTKIAVSSFFPQKMNGKCVKTKAQFFRIVLKYNKLLYVNLGTRCLNHLLYF